MSVQSTIDRKLRAALAPAHLEVRNESGNHSVPPGSESHFRITAVSPCFEHLKLLNRHRLVNEILADEIAGPLHALSIHALTPAEWATRRARVADSPPCLGGSKADRGD